MLAAPLDALAQDSNEPAATFNERFPADQTSTQPSLEIPETKKEQNATTTTRVVSAKHPRSRVVVARCGSYALLENPVHSGAEHMLAQIVSKMAGGVGEAIGMLPRLGEHEDPRRFER